MSSESPHSQPSSHARPKRPFRARNVVLTLGAVTVTAGVGISAASAGIIPGGAKEQVKAEAVDAARAKADAAAKEAAKKARSHRLAGKVSSTALPKQTLEELKKLRDKVKLPKPPPGKPSRTTGPTKPPAQPSAPTTPTTPPATNAPDLPADSTEAKVIALVNKERKAAGCSPITENAQLTKAADNYSDVMAKSGKMSHTGPDGSTMVTRVEAAGYTSWSNLGENIAMGQQDANAVMNAWMNSAGHRANILNCAFKEIGVGVNMGNNGPWWTQNFGTRR